METFEFLCGSFLIIVCGSFEIILDGFFHWNTQQALVQFTRAENEGIESRFFFGQWGHLLYEFGMHEKAIEKYKKSLLYPGDDTWTLLNISAGYTHLKKFEEAEHYAKKSLQIGIVPQAVANYLHSIFLQNNYQRFLSEYEVWIIHLTEEQRLEFNVLQGIAECKVRSKKVASDIFEAYKNTYLNTNSPSFKSLKACLNN